MSSYNWPPSNGSGGGVTSLNTLTGNVTLAAGTNITLVPVGNTITINSSNPGGSVTTVSVVSANGFAGTVANPTSTPAITLTTTITGILQGNGTSISAATLGDFTDSSSLADGITVSGGAGAVLGSGTSIAQAKASASQNGYLSSTDWSTFNGKQDSGNYITALTGDVSASGPGSAAATLATVNSDVGSFTNASITVNAKGLVTAASSGTTPITSISIASSNGFAGTSSGGATPALTLETSITGILKGNGTAISAATAGTDYVVPTVVTLPDLVLPTSQLSGSISLTSQVSGVLPIANGGTDNGTLAVTAGGVLYTDGTKFQNTGAGTSGYFLQSAGASTPTWQPLPAPTAVAVVSNEVPSNNPPGDNSNFTFIYTSIDLDTNSAYNTITGVFTVPVAGIYRCSFTARIDGSTFVSAWFIKNGASDLTPPDGSIGYFLSSNCVSVNGVIQCDLGDTLTLRTACNGGTPSVNILGTSMAIVLEGST